MADIELVIKIPEEVYNYIMRLEMCNMAEEYIKNGIPLPENHGQIVDLDTVTVEEDNDKGVLWLDAPTILEASYGK